MTTVDSPPKVLVVDDDKINLDTFRRVFRKDLNIYIASSGSHGLELVKTHEFDVLVVDYTMPEMNGLEFLHRVSQIRPNLRSVMVTAHADLPQIRAAQSEGIVAAVVLKPYETEVLLRWITQIHRFEKMRRSIASMSDITKNKS